MIYLIDTIGTCTGAHYYDESFYKIFKERNIDVKVLSNFKSHYSYKLFDNFYKGSKIKKLFFFSKAYFKYICFILAHWKHNSFVYECFGMCTIDILFIILFTFSDKFIIDIHDMYSFHKTKIFPKIQSIIYRNLIKTVIIHSDKARKELLKLGFKGKIIYTPHLPYMFDKNYNISTIPKEIIASVEQSKINLLFFGDIRWSKGLDILINALDRLDGSYLSSINLIIAGTDKIDMLQREKEKITNTKFTCHIFNRRIEEQEVNYLFSNVDYIILPYRDIYQSGVLEVATYFKVPFIASDLNLFQAVLNNYPSFGHIFSPVSPEGLKQILINITENGGKINYYTDEDLERFFQDNEINDFVEKLRTYIFHVSKSNVDEPLSQD